MSKSHRAKVKHKLGKPYKAIPKKLKPKMGYDDTIKLVNELGDHLNTFSLAIANGIGNEDLRNLIIKRMSDSGYMQIKQIGMQLISSDDPVHSINALRASLSDAINN